MANYKRYIISYKQEKADMDAAVQVLSVASNKVADGIRALIEEAAPEEDAVLHFSGIGSSVASLKEEDADRLKQDARVAQVTEDIEVFALGRRGYWRSRAGGECETDFAPGHMHEHPRAGLGHSFEAGYAQAVADMIRMASAGCEPGGPGARSDCPPGQEPWCFSLFGRRFCFCVPAQTPPGQDIPWNIQLVGADRVWDRVTGAGVRVAIIDTGIDDDHPDLTVAGGASFRAWRQTLG